MGRILAAPRSTQVAPLGPRQAGILHLGVEPSSGHAATFVSTTPLLLCNPRCREALRTARIPPSSLPRALPAARPVTARPHRFAHAHTAPTPTPRPASMKQPC
jgi:hypothetical protein